MNTRHDVGIRLRFWLARQLLDIDETAANELKQIAVSAQVARDSTP